MKILRTITTPLILGIISSNFLACQKENPVKILTNDGAWCWFSSPRAVFRYTNTAEVITGWVSSDGSIEACILDPISREKKIIPIREKIDRDDHANPSFTLLENQDALLCYAKHADTCVRFHRLPAASYYFSEELPVHVFNDEQFALYPKKGITYANAFVLSAEEGRLYCFGRWTGYKPNIMWSEDGGISFSPARVLITNKPFQEGNRPYVRYHSDYKSKIHMAFTDGHPRNEPLNSIYYACYEEGAFHRANGEKICTLEEIPFEPKNASLVYKATETEGRAWIYDISSGPSGHPVLLYARYPGETDHRYHYAIFNGKAWDDRFLCKAGKWFPQTPAGKPEKEPHYSGGMVIHPLDPDIIYLSRTVDDSFEIEKWKWSPNDSVWQKTAITSNSTFDNIRPVIPKNMKPGDPTVLLWMVNEKYVHYTDYKTHINYYIDP